MELPEKRAKSIGGIAAIAIVLALVGVAASAVVSGVYRSEKETAEAEQQKLSEYKAMIEELQAEKDSLDEEIGELDERYSAYLGELASAGEEYFNFVNRFETQNKLYRFYLGMTEVSGAGIEISLDDGNPIGGKLDSIVVVHDTTLLGIVDSLRAAGAQAISINGERIVAMTNIECVGPSVKVNGRKLFAPFTIKAIGNPESLHKSFINSEVYEELARSNLKMDVGMNNNIVIPKYTGTYASNANLFK